MGQGLPVSIPFTTPRCGTSSLLMLGWVLSFAKLMLNNHTIKLQNKIVKESHSVLGEFMTVLAHGHSYPGAWAVS
jgi:hypothetical protein